MDSVNINGEEYVKKLKTNHVAVICDRGWIFEGKIVDKTLFDASVVRKWSNGRGIGGLAKAKYKDEYTLDYVGTIELNPSAIIATIALEW